MNIDRTRLPLSGRRQRTQPAGAASPGTRRRHRPRPAGRGGKAQVEARGVRGGRPTTGAHRRRRQAPGLHLRLALWTTAVLTVGTIFGVAAFHVLLVQSQFRLDRLNKEAAVEEQRYEQLRLEVARLAAPERIVAAAQERLGMVVPPQVAYLMAPSPPSANPADPATPTLAGGWSEVKPHLGARR